MRQHAQFRQNSQTADIAILSTSKMATIRYLGFSKFQTFKIAHQVGKVKFLYRNYNQSVAKILRLTFLSKWRPSDILDLWAHFGITDEVYTWRLFIIVRNLVGIASVILIMQKFDFACLA